MCWGHWGQLLGSYVVYLCRCVFADAAVETVRQPLEHRPLLLQLQHRQHQHHDQRRGGVLGVSAGPSLGAVAYHSGPVRTTASYALQDFKQDSDMIRH